MSIEERERGTLRDRLDDVLGHEAADVLIRELDGMADDQRRSRASVDADIAEIRRDLAELRSDVNQLRTDVNELRGEMALLRSDLEVMLLTRLNENQQFLLGLQSQQTTPFRQLMYANLGSVLTVAALAFGAASIA